MFRNYFKTAWRNLLKNKTFSIVNIFGLSVGMSVCLLIIMIIKDANSYDRFHPASERTYRLKTNALRKDGGSEGYATSPYALANQLQTDYPFIENWVPLVRLVAGEAKAAGKNLPLNGLFTNNDFFTLFGFELLQGSNNALTEPFSIILTEATAERYFGKSNPIGETIELRGYGLFKVSGVMKKAPGKTHLDFEALASLESLKNLEKQGDVSPVTNNWLDYYQTYNFFRLRPGTTPAEVERALATISKAQYAGLELETRDKGYEFKLQPLNGITPGPELSNNMGRGLPAIVIYILSGLGFIVLLSACFNYTNLTVARAFNRAREIGVRKVVGASRGQVLAQFLSESILTALLALGGGYLLLKLLIPAMYTLQFTTEMGITFKEDIILYGWFLIFALATGLVAGLLPAAVLSRIRPISILQKMENLKLISRIGVRKVLIVIQFSLSLLFAFMITIMFSQFDYALNRDSGMKWDGVINIPLQNQSYTTISQEFSRLPFVQSVSGISHNIGTWNDMADPTRKNPTDEARVIREYFVDEHFMNTFGTSLVTGENFTANPTQQHELFLIVNEKFVKEFQLGTPSEALGQPIFVGDSTRLTIRGVVKDFNFRPAEYALEPMMLRYNPEALTRLNVKVSGTSFPEAVAALQQVWNKIAPERDFEYDLYDNIIKETYASQREITWMLSFFAFLSLTIACLGMLGMAIYTAQSKMKEVSIRKVFGAGFPDIFMFLSRGFIILLLIAAIIAVPAGYLFGNMFLQVFAYRISMNVWLFLPGLLVVGILAMGMVSSQVFRAASANPAETLRTE
ncbi:MAG: ABC transporter permease [Saprospiraceae bacterium]